MNTSGIGTLTGASIYKMKNILQLKYIYTLAVGKFIYKCNKSEPPATFKY